MKYHLAPLSGIVLGTILSISLSACWGDDAASNKENVIKNYASVAECSADTITTESTEEQKTQRGTDCQKAFDQALTEHQNTAKSYTSMNQCVDMYGENQCVQRGDSFYPLMMGFMLGYGTSGLLHSQPIYYDRWHYAYSGSASYGYYRPGGYMVMYHNAPTPAWASHYSTSTYSVPRGTAPTAAMRAAPRVGGFGTSATNGIASPQEPRAAISSPGVTRGGFGGSAAAASAGGGGGGG